MTIPKAPFSAWRNKRITLWWKRGSWIAAEAISSSPATGSTAVSAAPCDIGRTVTTAATNSISAGFAQVIAASSRAISGIIGARRARRTPAAVAIGSDAREVLRHDGGHRHGGGGARQKIWFGPPAE